MTERENDTPTGSEPQADPSLDGAAAVAADASAEAPTVRLKAIDPATISAALAATAEMELVKPPSAATESPALLAADDPATQTETVEVAAAVDPADAAAAAADPAAIDTDEMPAVADRAKRIATKQKAAERMASLRVRADDGSTSSVALGALWDGEAQSFGVGRGDDNEVHLPQRTVSRRHARLFMQDDAIHVEDLSSLTGVTINGHPISGPAKLGVNDRVEIGGYLMWFENEEGVAPFEAPTMRIEKRDIDLSDFE